MARAHVCALYLEERRAWRSLKVKVNEGIRASVSSMRELQYIHERIEPDSCF